MTVAGHAAGGDSTSRSTAVGVLVGELGGDAAAERVADDGGPVDAEHLEQVAHAVGVGRDRVVGAGLVRLRRGRAGRGRSRCSARPAAA